MSADDLESPGVQGRYVAPVAVGYVGGIPLVAPGLPKPPPRYCDCGNKLNSYNPGPCHACRQYAIDLLYYGGEV